MKADCTMAAAIALRTPLTGILSSAFFGASGVERFLNTDAWVAPLTTSSRRISPFTPLPLMRFRSTPRSRASFLIGGLAKTFSPASAALL